PSSPARLSPSTAAISPAGITASPTYSGWLEEFAYGVGRDQGSGDPRVAGPRAGRRLGLGLGLWKRSDGRGFLAVGHGRGGGLGRWGFGPVADGEELGAAHPVGGEVRGRDALLVEARLVAEAHGDAQGDGGHAGEYKHPRDQDEELGVGRGEKDDDQGAQARGGEKGAQRSVDR